MRSIDFRVPLIAGAAILLLAFSQAKAATAPVAKSTSQVVLTEEGAPKSDAQAEMLAMSDNFSDPRMQDGVANMVERMTNSMLDLPIGKFVAAIEQSVPGANKGKKRIRANDTVADLAGRDADRLPGQLATGSRQMMGMMSGFAAAFATMIPEFEKLGKDMENSFKDLEDVRRNGD